MIWSGWTGGIRFCKLSTHWPFSAFRKAVLAFSLEPALVRLGYAFQNYSNLRSRESFTSVGSPIRQESSCFRDRGRVRVVERSLVFRGNELSTSVDTTSCVFKDLEVKLENPAREH